MKSLIKQASNNSITFATGTTTYVELAWSLCLGNATDTARQVRYRTAGVMKKLHCQVSANATTTASTVTLNKVGVGSGNLTVSIAAAATGEFRDLTNTDSIANGDNLVSTVVVGATGALTLWAISYVFEPSNTPETVMKMTATVQNVTAASTTYFCHLSGNNENNPTSETGIGYLIRSNINSHHLFVNVTTARATTSTVKTRKNGADGNMTLSLTGGVTGIFEDTSNSDTLVSGDLYNLTVITGTGVDSLSCRAMVEFTTLDGTFEVISGDSSGGVAFGITRFGHIGGRASWASSETNIPTRFQVAARARNLRMYVMTNSVNGDATLQLRVNSNRNLALACIILASSTGQFEDTTSIAEIGDEHTLSYRIVTGGSSGTLVMRYLGFTALNKPDNPIQKPKALRPAAFSPGHAR